MKKSQKKKPIFFGSKTSKRNLTHFRPPPPPKFFQIFIANFISFHLHYSKSTCLEDDFCKQLLTAGGQKLIFSGFFFEIWPQGKIFATFFASYDQNCGITAWYWKKNFPLSDRVFSLFHLSYNIGHLVEENFFKCILRFSRIS